MVREKVTVSTRTLQWKCVESREDSKRLYYERFILSPLMKDQADTIGIAMRRTLLSEILSQTSMSNHNSLMYHHKCHVHGKPRILPEIS